MPLDHHVDENLDDPFEAHFHREPMTGAGVRVIVLDPGEPERARAIGRGLTELLTRHGRESDSRIVPLSAEGNLGRAIESGYAGTDFPLVLVTTATEPWADDHLKPLLLAIDRCDHVVGRCPESTGSRIRGWLSRLRHRVVFAIPVREPHNPCRLHRRSALDAIPLQSATDFVDIEILAKATFLGQLIDEVGVPPIAGFSLPAASRAQDFQTVFRHPRFVRASRPAEDFEGDEEGCHGPDAQDREGPGDLG